MTPPPPMYTNVFSMCLRAHAATIAIAATGDAGQFRVRPTMRIVLRGENVEHHDREGYSAHSARTEQGRRHCNAD
jgi:hypothetical protein